jgi:hypothetical protein
MEVLLVVLADGMPLLVRIENLVKFRIALVRIL